MFDFTFLILFVASAANFPTVAVTLTRIVNITGLRGGDKPSVQLLTSPAMPPMTGLGYPIQAPGARNEGILDYHASREEAIPS